MKPLIVRDFLKQNLLPARSEFSDEPENRSQHDQPEEGRQNRGKKPFHGAKLRP